MKQLYEQIASALAVARQAEFKAMDAYAASSGTEILHTCCAWKEAQGKVQGLEQALQLVHEALYAGV